MTYPRVLVQVRYNSRFVTLVTAEKICRILPPIIAECLSWGEDVQTDTEELCLSPHAIIVDPPIDTRLSPNADRLWILIETADHPPLRDSVKVRTQIIAKKTKDALTDVEKEQLDDWSRIWTRLIPGVDMFFPS